MKFGYIWLVVSFLTMLSVGFAGNTTGPTQDVRRVLTYISANSLRGNLSFLASDSLEGRWTPSRGLDVAAEFIASRFRGAGLEPLATGSYFQVADLTDLAKASPQVSGRKISTPILAKNVGGLLRGSDPVLRDSYVIVSSHYDHLGTLETSGKLSRDKSEVSGDYIFNGANDDGSGTVSLIEIAAALAKLKVRPKRSVVFLAFCGEELGLLGSSFYVQHPLFPLKKTVADINLEQVGRSDSEFGRERATLTGYDFTSMTQLFEHAAELNGMKMVKTKPTVEFFAQSDNYSFALVGIPDTTLLNAYEFADYHGLKDEWPKIDFETMAKIDRIAALVILDIANAAAPPRWNAAVESVSRFTEAAEQLKH